MSTHHPRNDYAAHARASSADTAMAELLELDAEVLNPYLTRLTSWLAHLAEPAPTRILDLGSGPGTGSLALARQFPEAVVTAVDLSAQMLHRLQKQAATQGVADRVHVLQANLDEQWPRIGGEETFDLMWSAAFLHHLTDPHRALRQAFNHLRPGGLFVVTEMDFFPLFLPRNAGPGRPGLEARLHAATNTRPAHEWTNQLIEAGFTVTECRPFEVRLDRETAGPALNRYARACLAMLRSHAESALADDDLAALDALLDDTRADSIGRRGDLTVRTTRTAWVARRS